MNSTAAAPSAQIDATPSVAAMRGASGQPAPLPPIDCDVGHDDNGNVYVSLSRGVQGFALPVELAEKLAAALRTHAGIARRGGKATAGNTRVR